MCDEIIVRSHVREDAKLEAWRKAYHYFSCDRVSWFFGQLKGIPRLIMGLPDLVG